MNILFGLNDDHSNGEWKLTIDILDCNSKDLPLFKITVNGQSWKYRIPIINKNNLIEGEISDSSEFLIEITLENRFLRTGRQRNKFNNT